MTIQKFNFCLMKYSSFLRCGLALQFEISLVLKFSLRILKFLLVIYYRFFFRLFSKVKTLANPYVWFPKKFNLFSVLTYCAILIDTILPEMQCKLCRGTFERDLRPWSFQSGLESKWRVASSITQGFKGGR